MLRAAPCDGRGLLTSVGLDYVRQFGWSVLPVDRATKRPLLSRWKWLAKMLPKRRDLARWQDIWPIAGVAVITGQVSGGLFVIDADGQAAIDEIEKRGVPWSPVASTPRGGRHYYFTTNETHSNAAKLGKCKSIDIRAERGYVVAAPTQNGVGNYTWIVPPREGKALNAPPDWIFKLCSDHAGHMGVEPVSGVRSKVVPTASDEAILAGLRPKVREMVMTRFKKGERSEADLLVVRALVGMGASLDTIEDLFARYPIGEKYREKLAAGDDIARSYIALAMRSKFAVDMKPRSVVTVRYADLNTHAESQRIYLALVEEDTGRLIRCGVTVPNEKKPGESRYTSLFQAAQVPVSKNVVKAARSLVGKRLVVELQEDGGPSPVRLFLPFIA